jgi:hypothetical protein
VSAVFHGHAHRGAPEGRTTPGVPGLQRRHAAAGRLNPDRPPFLILELPLDGEAPPRTRADSSETHSSNGLNPAQLPRDANDDSSATSLTTPDKAELYRTALEMLNRSGVPYMVGGTYAFQYYAGISTNDEGFRHLRPAPRRPAFSTCCSAPASRRDGAFSHWLAKAHHGDKFIDVIYSSGNACADVDDEWFAHAVDEEVLGVPVKLCPPRRMIWSKAMIMERERYDGADVAHLFRHCSGLLNWERLCGRFGRTGACCSATSCCSGSSIRASAR